MWRRRPNRDIFDEMDHEFEEINNMMERMFRTIRSQANVEPGKPLVYGFSMKVGPDGIPHVEQFGNVRPTGKGMISGDVREPYSCNILDSEKNQLCITAEMPGITREDVTVDATDTVVTIKAETKDRKYFKEIPTDAPIDPDSGKAKYNNGVLELTFKLKGDIKPKGKKINVD
ncbi:MAG: Hsp20/alpha crystallin family protein [ANME-2 cluster archaeon]|nr:MAG: Hsp20/alpha crystallin family protein [ANME-2 cluster archaeon]HUW67203.1 archaeal heat shock protein Hsp20 [Candidatus Nanoarchaeia archaeon]